jgi:hypothetical protein
MENGKKNEKKMENGKGMLGFEPKSLAKRKELYLSYIPTKICH